MSRIIIKNIPNGYTETKIRAHFSRVGKVTDIQLKFTADGKFRNFGFIGYETVEQATNAIQEFNNTFLRTSKISVEPCVAIKDVDQIKTWSKHSIAIKEKQNQNKSDSKNKSTTLTDIYGKHKHDAQFKDYAEVQGRAGMLVWDNKMHHEQLEHTDNEINDKDEHQELEDKNESQPETNKSKRDFRPLFVAKIHNIPVKTKRQDIFRFFRPVKPYSVRVPHKQKGFAYAGFKTEAELKRALLKDKSFFGGKQVKVVDFTAKNQPREQPTKEKKHKNPMWLKQEDSVQNESIMETGKLFYRNLPYTVNENDLRQLFEKVGPVTDVDLPIDSNTRTIKGFGTVTFLMPEHAVTAYTTLNGTFFHGRMFHLLPAKVDEKERSDQEGDEIGLSYKEKKEKKLKKTAQSSHNWNTLFMGENAVADIVATKYGTTKEEVLSAEKGKMSVAVKLALGETEIVMSMRKFLEEQGIYLDAFNDVAEKRSNTIILVKNLPAGTNIKELIERFSKFGLLGRTILPPNGVTAIIEFLDPSEAKNAFKKLAYTRFKSLPLYLEWAPENTFSNEARKEGQDKSCDTETKQEIEEPEDSTKTDEKDAHEASDLVPEEGTTLFIKNLSFQTDENSIREKFQNIGPIHSIQVVRKKDGESRGYGFIQFKLRKSADMALKNLFTVSINGRQVELSRSDRTLKLDVSSARRKATNAKKQTGSKILVRNVPFQTNVQEIRELFKVFGNIKSIRLPKKMVPGSEESHRGFCFVDFASEAEAKQAFEALCKSTHLYGRRLVLEWADANDDVDELRKRTANKFSAGASKKGAKSVFDASTVTLVDRSDKDEIDMESNDETS